MAGARIKRGEIWMIDLGMAQKIRPALVLSISYLDTERALVTFVPRTTTLWNTRFEVEHRSREFRPGAFDIQGIGTTPAAKLLRRLSVLDEVTLNKVEGAVRLWLGL